MHPRVCTGWCSILENEATYLWGKGWEEGVEEDEGEGDLGHVRGKDKARGGGDIFLLGDREADVDG